MPEPDEASIHQLVEVGIHFPDVATLVLTDAPSRDVVTACLRAGARGIVPRTLDAPARSGAVQDLVEGLPVLGQQVQVR